MISSHPAQITGSETFIAAPEKIRRSVLSEEPVVLTDIYQEDTNIVVWQRKLSESLLTSVKELLISNPTFQTAMTVTPENALSNVSESLGADSHTELSENVAELVDMFCCLFGLKRAGLRFSALDHAMCPRFHVDKVPCRLVTTYHGIATEWLSHQCVNREKLGPRSSGQSDRQAGLFHHKSDIQQLNSGDVALLKGELWDGNENAGLVHRSPALVTGERRLLLTLDFSN